MANKHYLMQHWCVAAQRVKTSLISSKDKLYNVQFVASFIKITLELWKIQRGHYVPHFSVSLKLVWGKISIWSKSRHSTLKINWIRISFLEYFFFNCWWSASIFDKSSKVKAIQLKVINYFTSTVCFVTGRLSTFHMARYTSLLFEQS